MRAIKDISTRSMFPSLEKKTSYHMQSLERNSSVRKDLFLPMIDETTRSPIKVLSPGAHARPSTTPSRPSMMLRSMASNIPHITATPQEKKETTETPVLKSDKEIPLKILTQTNLDLMLEKVKVFLALCHVHIADITNSY
jgi:hypothetical protein